MKCKNCSEPFSWKSIRRSIFFGYKPLTCESCGSVHYVSFWTRILVSVFTTTVPLFLVFSRVIPLKPVNAVMIYLLWIFLSTYISPFFVRYELRQNEGRP